MSHNRCATCGTGARSVSMMRNIPAEYANAIPYFLESGGKVCNSCYQSRQGPASVVEDLASMVGASFLQLSVMSEENVVAVHKPFGLLNLGATCYLNGGLGVLFSSTLMSSNLLAGLHSSLVVHNAFLVELQNIAEFVEASPGLTVRNVPSLRLFQALVKFDHMYSNPKKHEDLLQLLDVVFWCVNGRNGSSMRDFVIGGHEDLIYAAFGATFLRKQVCSANNCAFDEVMDPVYISLLELNCWSITALLSQLTDTTIDGGRFDCVQCKSKNSCQHSQQLISLDGESVCVGFKRSTLDFVKLFRPIEIQEYIHLFDFVLRLACVVVHSGETAQTGHYWLYRRVGNDWFYINDGVVAKTCFGRIAFDLYVMENVYCVVYNKLRAGEEPAGEEAVIFDGESLGLATGCLSALSGQFGTRLIAESWLQKHKLPLHEECFRGIHDWQYFGDQRLRFQGQQCAEALAQFGFTCSDRLMVFKIWELLEKCGFENARLKDHCASLILNKNPVPHAGTGVDSSAAAHARHQNLPVADGNSLSLAEVESSLRDGLVAESSKAIGLAMKEDMSVQLKLVVCAVCSEKVPISTTTVVVVNVEDIPLNSCGQQICLDGAGILGSFCDGAYNQMFACNTCYSGGFLHWKMAQFNVYGLGVLTDKFWLPEECLVTPIVSSVSVKNSGPGSHSFKRESSGFACYAYHNVLETLSRLLEIHSKDRFVSVAFMYDGGATGSHSSMLVRVGMVFKLIATRWRRDPWFRSQCLTREFNSESKVDQALIAPMVAAFEALGDYRDVQLPQRDASVQHFSVWRVQDESVKRFYVRVGKLVAIGDFSEQELFCKAHPTLFPNFLYSQSKGIAKAMTFAKLAKHMLLLQDNRLGLHDQALFVINNRLMRQKIFSCGMFDGFPEYLDQIKNLRVVRDALEHSVREAQHKYKQQDADAEPDADGTQQEREADTTVRTFINAVKSDASRIQGHPAGVAFARKVMKGLHRSEAPADLWLTINISDAGNKWLEELGVRCGESISVSSGGVAQARFFDAMVKSMMQNVLNAVFKGIKWAGAVVEYCLNGTCHLHLVGALQRCSPQVMLQLFQNKDQLQQLEVGW